MVVLALVPKRARIGPSLDDDIVGLVEPLPVIDWVSVGGDAFLADASDEAADDPASGEDVDHGDFFGDPERVLVNR